MSKESGRFSINLGPELDPPRTEEWGWVEEGFEDDSKPTRIARKDKTRIGREQRKAARQRKGPKSIPPRSFPPFVEISGDPELEDILQDLKLDDAQAIAEETTQNQIVE